MRTGVVVAAVLAVVVALVHAGQQDRQLPTYASGVSLVEVYASVTDRTGEPIQGLPRDAFEVLEDGVAQRIEAFAAGDFPLSVALALDHSASMTGEPLAMAKAAGRAFLAALRPEDQVMVLGVSSEIEVLAPLSTNRAAARDAIESLKPWSTTPLHDAVLTAIDRVQEGTGRRALVLVSDGEDRYSQATESEVLDRARRSDVMVFPVAVGRGRVTPLFAQLATLTGGRSIQLNDARQLTPALESIARELRLQYLLGYAPARLREAGATVQPEWHGIEVRVNRTGLRVRARDGYLGR